MAPNDNLTSLRLDSLEEILTDVWKHLRFLETTILDLKRGLEIMAEKAIYSPNELDSIKYQVAALAESTDELEKRVILLEKHNSLVNWILRQFGTVLLVLLAIYLGINFF